jgi:primosomal protein N' (replication factor Y)
MSSRAAVVALPIPSPVPYHYAVPATLEDRVRPGARVVVPVRSRELVGVVLRRADGRGDEGAPDALKQVLLAPDPAPLVSESLLALARWIAGYYATPIGLTLRAMLPSALWGSSRLVAELRDDAAAPGGASRDVIEALGRMGGRAGAAALSRRVGRPVWDALQRLARVGAVTLETEPPDLGPGARREKVLTLTRPLPTLLERDETFGRARRQREAYEAVDAMGGAATVRHLKDQLGLSAAVLRGLVDRGVARFDEEERLRDPFAGVEGVRPAMPTEDQRRAIGEVRALPAGGAATLFGVTGSGKTLVYLEALRPDIDAGGSAIVLVPEISLTPQTIARVRGAFGDTVAVLHSGLSEGERVDAWRALAQGTRRVAIGARSAVFAPMAGLAAVIVDEEHDHSYKNGEAPRYHARDVAIRRAQLEGARVVLGSATPSLDTWARRDTVRVIHLPDRIGMRPLPPVHLLDLRREERVTESGAVPWSVALDTALRETLDAGDQALLLLNRRGYAHFLQCSACGYVWECPSCSVALTVHQSPPRLRCHHCGHDERLPERCAACGGDARRTRGVGTQALERWLAERFPRARLARMDADTTTRKWSHQRLLDAVGRREVDLLFGTQMIAKGLDFPGVTLVGVVDADTGLHLPDFRSAERTFQLVAQVAGRAGRGPRGGRVLVQTRNPEHPALTAAAAHDYEAFAAGELPRRRTPPYPPHVALANVVLSGQREERVAAAAVEVAEWVQGLSAARAEGAVEVVGPAPAPLARIKGRWRWHLLLRAEDARWLGRVVRYASRRAPHAKRGPVRLVFDRDPLSLL